MLSPPNEISVRLAIKPIRDTLRFAGRSTRTELISYLLLYIIVMFLAVAISILFRRDDPTTYFDDNPLGIAIQILFWLPGPALASRRMHDVRLPGWPAAIMTASFAVLSVYLQHFRPDFEFPLAVALSANVAGLVLLVACFWNDDPDDNRYGPNPRYDPQPNVSETQ